MKTDSNGKVWATWREWLTMGRKDARAGKDPAYPSQPDYMAGYESEQKNHVFLR